MPDYGQPIENDLNFSSLIDFFRGKGKKDKEPDVKVPMGKRGPKTVRGNPKGEDTQEFVNAIDKDLLGKKKEPDVIVGTEETTPTTHTSQPEPHVEQVSTNKKKRGPYWTNKAEWHDGLEDDHAVDGFTVADWKEFKRTPPSHRIEGKDYSGEGAKATKNYPQDPDTIGAEKKWKFLKPESYKGSVENSLLKLMKETIEEGGAAEQINRLKGTEQYNLPFNVEYRPATADDVADDIETLATEHGPMHVVQHRGPSHEPPNLQNTVENSLLKLMKADEEPKQDPSWVQRIKQPPPTAEDVAGTKPHVSRFAPGGKYAIPDEIGTGAHGGTTISSDRDQGGNAPPWGTGKRVFEDRRFKTQDQQEEDAEGIDHFAADERAKGNRHALGSSYGDWKTRIYENAVEKSLIKLMKDGDTQELNAMDNPPKENKESQALVADGDSKRPKSEVGTNDKMFKKADDFQADKAKRWAKIKRDVEARRANQAKQETLPGFEPPPPEDEPPTPDQSEHGGQVPPQEYIGDLTTQTPGVKTTRPMQGWKFAEGPEGRAQMEAWWKEHFPDSADTPPPTDVEQSLLKLMKVSSLPDDFDDEKEKYEGDHEVVNYGQPLTGQEAMRRMTSEQSAFEGDVPHRETLPHYIHPGDNKPDSEYIQAIRDAQNKARIQRVSEGEEYKHPDEGFHVNSVEKSLVKLMKEGEVPKKGRPEIEPMPEVPGNESIANYPSATTSHMGAAGGETKGQKLPASTPFTVTDKPFDFAEHRANQQRLEAMWEAVESGDVKLNMQEHADFVARMHQWGRDEALAREGLRHHPAVAHRAANRALRNSSPVENSLLKLIKEGEIRPDKVGMTRRNALKNLDKANGGANMGGMAQPKAAAQPAFADSATQEAQGMDTGVDHGRMANFQAYNQALGATEAASKLPGQAMDAASTAAKLGGRGAMKVGQGVGSVVGKIGSMFGGGKGNAQINPTSNTMNYYSRDMKR